MTAPRWQLLRQAWGQPTSDIHALRRARARKAWNRRRQEVARWRRRVLRQLLTQRGRGGLVSLEGAGTRELYQAYWELTGASRRTFFADLRVLREGREADRLRAGIGAVPAGPGAGTDTGAGDGASVGPPNPSLKSASPSAAPQSAAPGRPALISSWYWYATMLELALDRLLPPEVAGAVRTLAQQYLSRLAPPRRVGAPALPSTFAGRSVEGDGAPTGEGDSPAFGPTSTTALLLAGMFGPAPGLRSHEPSPPQPPTGSRRRAGPALSPNERPPRDPADWW